MHHSDWHIISNEEEARNKEWLVLARFLEQIPNLRDVVYACTHRIPTCILAALHRYHPNTRLHLYTVNLDHFAYRRYLHRRSQSDSYTDPNTDPNTNPHELFPLLSPCLHSLVVLHSMNNYYRCMDYFREIAEQRIRIASSRLRHLRVSCCPFPPSHDHIYRPSYRTRWQCNPARTVLPPIAWSRETAQNLVLDMFGLRDSQNDVSPLHSLMIHNHVSVEFIHKLTQISEKGALNSIHTLALWIACNRATRPSIDEAASLLLQRIPPLKDLKLMGPVANHTFTMILSCQGETLRKLQFIPACEYSMHENLYFTNLLDVHELSKRCPNLEQVELRTRRTRGDEEEMSVYRALSTLRRLKRVKLHLDCSPSRLQDDNGVWQPFDKRRAELHIRESLINSAIDSSLAQSIFLAIFPSANTTTVPNQQLPTLELQSLVDGPVDGCRHIEDFYCILYSVAKCWVVSARRDASDNAGKGTEAEAGARTVLRVRELRKNFNPNLMPDLIMYEGIDVFRRVWKELWPPKTKKQAKVWWENRWSFPLFSPGVSDGNGTGTQNGTQNENGNGIGNGNWNWDP